MLFSFAGGSGHFEPLVPIAQSCVAAGHTVAFAGQPPMVPVIEAAGFTAFATGGATLSSTPKRLPLLKLDRAREERDLREGFVRRIATERADAILARCADWCPDVLVCDETDFGAMVAAERLNLPYATVLVIAAGSFVRQEVVGKALNELRAAHHLPPDPDLAMLTRYLVLVPVPSSYRDPAFPLPPTAHSIRPRMLDFSHNNNPPSWSAPVDDRPIVYFTLGTVFNVESGDLFERVLAGLSDLPINVIATVGGKLDPSEFGPQPPHIQIAQYIPQAAILPHCTLVVSHGGSGSVIGALSHGCPMVLLPIGADQPWNADRCADLGVACVLNAIEATPTSIREVVVTVMSNPDYQSAANHLRDEIASLPDPEYAVQLLERLVVEKQPIVST
ncbi:MAG: nucleotide disphospho-sugar-binding domain-containing protein [Chloroflexota bacterium]